MGFQKQFYLSVGTITTSLFMAVGSIQASAENTAANANIAMTNVLNQLQSEEDSKEWIQQVFAEIYKNHKWKHKRKTRVGLGTLFFNGENRKTSNTLYNRGKGYVLSFGQDFSPNFSLNAMFINTLSKNKLKTFDNRSRNTMNAPGVSADWRVHKNLTLDFSLGALVNRSSLVSPTTQRKQTNQRSYSLSPSLALDFNFRAGNFLILPSLKQQHNYIVEKRHINLKNTAVGRKTLKMDQTFVQNRLLYAGNPLVIPYVTAGFGYTSHYSRKLKSRKTFQGGAGVMLYAGALSIDYTYMNQHKENYNNRYSLNASYKF